MFLLCQQFILSTHLIYSVGKLQATDFNLELLENTSKKSIVFSVMYMKLVSKTPVYYAVYSIQI
jgi:hypothetical protein